MTYSEESVNRTNQIHSQGAEIMKIEPYIAFNGNCREAIEFYSKALNAKPVIITYQDMPETAFPITDEIKNLVLHANLNIGPNQIMMCDVMPGNEVLIGNNISISLLSNDKEELKNWFDQLSEGGNILMPLEETFFSKLFGFFSDKFGILWQVSYED